MMDRMNESERMTKDEDEDEERKKRMSRKGKGVSMSESTQECVSKKEKKESDGVGRSQERGVAFRVNIGSIVLLHTQTCPPRLPSLLFPQGPVRVNNSPASFWSE